VFQNPAVTQAEKKALKASRQDISSSHLLMNTAKTLEAEIRNDEKQSFYLAIGNQMSYHCVAPIKAPPLAL